MKTPRSAASFGLLILAALLGGQSVRAESPEIPALAKYIDQQCEKDNSYSMILRAYLGSSECGRVDFAVKRTANRGYQMNVTLKSDLNDSKLHESATLDLDSEFRTQRIEYSSSIHNVLVVLHRLDGEKSYMIELRSQSEETVFITPLEHGEFLLPIRVYQALAASTPASVMPTGFFLVHSSGEIGQLSEEAHYEAGNLEFGRQGIGLSPKSTGIGIGRDSAGEVRFCGDCATGLFLAQDKPVFVTDSPIGKDKEFEVRCAVAVSELLQDLVDSKHLIIGERIRSFKDASIVKDRQKAIGELREWLKDFDRSGISRTLLNETWALAAYTISEVGDELVLESSLFPSVRFKLTSNGQLELTAMSIPSRLTPR